MTQNKISLLAKSINEQAAKMGRKARENWDFELCKAFGIDEEVLNEKLKETEHEAGQGLGDVFASEEPKFRTKAPACPVCGKTLYLSYNIFNHEKVRCRRCGHGWFDHALTVRKFNVSEESTDYFEKAIYKMRFLAKRKEGKD